MPKFSAPLPWDSHKKKADLRTGLVNTNTEKMFFGMSKINTLSYCSSKVPRYPSFGHRRPYLRYCRR